ncbi:unnamed protein product [Soboliphyme baturini]|uniref:Transcription factor SOX-13 n=1 Tax=Soboliphyme baturini TaxID=241478 RepID=A0A183J309_9BILA|nr:unnamed protein product [Soboliphyme baturini]
MYKQEEYHYLPPEVMSDHCYGRMPSAVLPPLSPSVNARRQKVTDENEPPTLNRNDDECLSSVAVEPSFHSPQNVSHSDSFGSSSSVTKTAFLPVDVACSDHEFGSSITSGVIASSLQHPMNLSNGGLSIINEKLPANILEGEETDFMEQSADVELH